MTSTDFVEVFTRKRRGGPDQFDWRRIDGRNGQVIAGSAGQGYVDEDFAVKMAARCNRTMRGEVLQLRRTNPTGGFEVIDAPVDEDATGA